MATFRKRGEKWQAIVRRRNKTFAHTFPSRALAETWAAEKEAEVLLDNPLQRPAPPPDPSDVIVVCGYRLVRVSPLAWKDVLDAAGLMADRWSTHQKSLGREQEQIDASLSALNRLAIITEQGR